MRNFAIAGGLVYVLSLLLFAGGACGQGQLAWSVVDTSSPTPRYYHATAFDTDRHVLVLFGGLTGETDTWEYAPATNTWRMAAPNGAGPSRRGGHAMVYDPVHHVTVLSGGSFYNGSVTTVYSDVWEWNGSAWTQRTGGAALATGRNLHATAFDSTRQKVVLYGGTTALPAGVDTPEYTGTTWSTGETVNNPGGVRFSHGMAFDSVRNRMVLIPSGTGGGSTQVYEYLTTGGVQDWISRSFTTTIPALRQWPLLAFDSNRGVTLLTGGDSADTWTYDGTTWTRRVQGGFSRVRSSIAFDPDSGHAFVYSGNFYATNNHCECDAFRQLYSWDGSSWTLVWSNGLYNARFLAGAAYDEARGKTVVFGGRQLNPSNFSGISPLNVVVEWDGSAWSSWITPTPNPGSRCEAPLVYDAARRVSVLYGGLSGPAEQGGATAQASTWEYDGSSWTHKPDGPGQRWRHASTFDKTHGTMVVFGGADQTGTALGDTWEYDGTTWNQRMVAGPSARSGAAMVYDTANNRCILFGGSTGSAVLDDTWVWDGSTWAEVPIPVGSRPSPRQMAGMAYDTRSGRTILYAGRSGTSGNAVTSTVWSLSGAQWTQLAVPTPLARAGMGFVYDTARNVFVLTTGASIFDVNYTTAQTWEGTFPCSAAPLITQNPSSVTACQSGVALMTVAAGGIGGGPFTYQWQLQTTPPPNEVWSNLTTSPLPLPCGGSATATAPTRSQSDISIIPCSGVISYQLRCIVSNACGSVTSNPATYTVCYANCDCSTASPALNVLDFTCFLQQFAAGATYANCDGSTSAPVLNVLDFTCFLQKFAAGCP